MSSPYEDLGRFEKALKIADALDAAGFGSSAVADFHAGQWRMSAWLAKVSEPGKQTQSCVIVMLRNREGVRRIMENLSSKAAGRANGALATGSGESEGDKAQRRGAENYERAANAPRKGAHA